MIGLLSASGAGAAPAQGQVTRTPSVTPEAIQTPPPALAECPVCVTLVNIENRLKAMEKRAAEQDKAIAGLASTLGGIRYGEDLDTERAQKIADAVGALSGEQKGLAKEVSIIGHQVLSLESLQKNAAMRIQYTCAGVRFLIDVADSSFAKKYKNKVSAALEACNQEAIGQISGG